MSVQVVLLVELRKLFQRRVLRDERARLRLLLQRRVLLLILSLLLLGSLRRALCIRKSDLLDYLLRLLNALRIAACGALMTSTQS